MMSLKIMGLTPNPLILTIFYAFSLHLGYSIGGVSSLGSGVFVPTGVESKCDIFAFVMFTPIEVDSKGDGLIETFLH